MSASKTHALFKSRVYKSQTYNRSVCISCVGRSAQHHCSSYFDFKAPLHIRQSIDDCWNKLQEYSLREAPPPPFLAPSHLDFSMASVWLTAGLGLGTAGGSKQFKQQPGKENYCLLGLLYLALTPGLIWPEFTAWSLVPDTDPALPQLLDPVVSVTNSRVPHYHPAVSP